MRHPLPLLILAGLGMLAASGCQRAADAATEAAIERASGQQVGIDRDGERLRITSADGAVLHADGHVVMVWIDRRSGRPTPLPAAVRRVAGA